jgi:uncharacterized lipoprotein YddW (UPF0748 family)
MKTVAIFLSLILLLTACGQVPKEENQSGEIALNSLSLQYESLEDSLIEFSQTADAPSTVLNYPLQNGMWFPYMDYAETLTGKTESEFREIMNERFANAKTMNVNTVYVQVRAFCDAYYDSKIFPKAYDNNFDPMKIMIEIAHSKDLSFHAWLNPLRGKPQINVKAMRDFFVEENGRYYLNPAHGEVIDFVANGVREIVENYDVDGIHIDDYFYPTTDESFDSAEYDGIIPLPDFRRKNVDKLVQAMYNAAKSKDHNVLFCISPQGNIYNNYNVLYADVEKWCKEPGYCDYIIPQLYYGFKNQVCPFEPTLEKWIKLTENSSVTLSAGICTYKIGVIDTYAGSGKTEWIDDPDVFEKQSEILKQKNIGTSIYSYSSTFSE